MNLSAGHRVERVTIEAVITRADGTVEDRGVIANTIYGADGLPPSGARAVWTGPIPASPTLRERFARSLRGLFGRK